MSILNHLLDKLNKRPETLTEADKAMYKDWDNALKGRKITDDDVYNFIQESKIVCTNKLRDITELNEHQKIFYSMQLDFILKIEFFLTLPVREKNQANQQIESILETLD
ncbi:MAG: hypothetical protein ACTSQE_12585 [Candidatus Heimdallarchaeaceae archaeon]